MDMDISIYMDIWGFPTHTHKMTRIVLILWLFSIHLYQNNHLRTDSVLA